MSSSKDLDYAGVRLRLFGSRLIDGTNPDHQPGHHGHGHHHRDTHDAEPPPPGRPRLGRAQTHRHTASDMEPVMEKTAGRYENGYQSNYGPIFAKVSGDIPNLPTDLPRYLSMN